MTPDGGRDGQVLNRLPLSPDRAAALQAQPGFVSGSYSTFSGPAGFLLTWAAQYASDDQAAGALSIVLDEMQSDDGYGWGLGDDAGLGGAAAQHLPRARGRCGAGALRGWLRARQSSHDGARLARGA